jgi:hypothetical protein
VTESPNGGSADDRTAMAKAVEWATIAMTVSAEMVVPGLIGYWFDQQLGNFFETRIVLFVLLGFAGGLVLAIWHLLKILKSSG